MWQTLLLAVSIYLPLVSASSPPPSTPPPIDPAIVAYAADVTEVWNNYRTVATDLVTFAAQLLTNPLLVREPVFTLGVRAITTKMRLIRIQLDNVPSPPAVDEIHEELEEASDIFNAAAVKLDRFGVDHDFDDFADAFELVTRGAAIWTYNLNQLNDLITPGALAGQTP
jgi:hypothetical protein